MQGSDVIAQATMPATAPRGSFRRSNSWQDNLSYFDGMSWTGNSLAGGGIHESGSLISGRSTYSQLMRDSDSLMEQLMQNSVASRRNNQVPYAQALYNRNSPPQPSSGASVASMSVASGGLASLGSVKTIMSDLSANLVALDLAEPHLPDDFMEEHV